jgi:hypothetical protein
MTSKTTNKQQHISALEDPGEQQSPEVPKDTQHLKIFPN